MTSRRWLLGDKLNPFDPGTRRRIALVAVLAWIGLGADGLSSSTYGPEEAFLALGTHTELALFLAIATAVTVFIIAASYNQVIDLFPSGGGGYKAATRLIGPRAGLISGSALIGTYTGIEAVSNNVNMLAEPRVKTGHWTWVTLLITGAVAALCVLVRRHYDEVRQLMRRVDDYAPRVTWLEEPEPLPLDPNGRTALILVGPNRGAGYQTLEWVLKTFPGGFRNLFTSLLHNQLPLAVQRRLHVQGRHMIIVPVKLPAPEPARAQRLPLH